MPNAALADAVLLIHFGVVLFVIGGLVAVLLGNRLGWPWVNRWNFRLIHACAIAVIVAQAWLGQHCPLTLLEHALRVRAGEAVAIESGFIAYWVSRLLYVDAPLWMLAIAYTVFGLLVAWAWWRFPPRSGPRNPTVG